MVFASASGSSGKPKPKPQQWSSELPTYITVYVNKPASQTSQPSIPNDIVAFVPPAPPVSTSPPRPSNAARPGNRPPQPPPSDPRDDVDHQARPGERRGSSGATQNQAPTKPDYSPDAEEESETAAFNAREAWSYEDIFLSMDAVDLSYYSSLQEYDLVREAAISLRHEKFILHYLDKPREFLKHFATYTWDEEADAAAEEFIQWYVERFRPKLERQRDIDMSGPAFGEAEEAIEDLTAGEEEDTLKDLTSGEAEDTIKRWHQDLTNDEREVVIAIDLRTGETLFVRYGDEDSVTLHDEQQKLVEDRYVALLHHHPNNSAASLADLDATVWMKAEFLLVTNQDGTLHRYARVGEAMIPLEPTRNPEYAAPVDPLETAAADAAYLAQTLLEMGNPPERVMEQGEATAVIEVSGAFRAYGNQWYADERRGEIETFMNYDFTDNPQTFSVLRRSALNPSLIQIEVRNPDSYQVYHHWVDVEDLEGNYKIRNGNLDNVPILYPLRSFVADETLDVELIGEDPTWPDKSGVGVRSRDFNEYNSTKEFLLQSPTIGPEVIVEFVATDHQDLGNFVVISFPASVFQENETVMQNLSGDPNHDPSQWREDGRVFVAFAHLSDWEEWGLQRPQPGTYLDSPEKGIIGMTGNTGTQVNHLDLSVVYYGSMDDGTQQMREALAAVRSNRTSVDFYFGLAGRSNFVGKPNVYAENVDPVRVWPELDELERAEYTKGKSIYSWKN